MISERRAFILEHTRLQWPARVPELQLHLADELTPIWRMTEEQSGAMDVPPPFWAVSWVGGQALARYLLDHRHTVTGKRIVDVATGSGMCAIAAMKAGAASALAADVDPFCEAAVPLNAQANGVRVTFTGRDLLAADPPDTDLILAGDVCYEEPMAARMLAWLRAAHTRGIRVLIGDPGRAHFPRADLLRLAEYEVPTTRELEGSASKRVGVFTFPGA